MLALMLGADSRAALAQVVGAQVDNARLEHLRGLAFKKPVPVVAMKPEDAQRVIEANLMREYSNERLRADGIAGSMIGLVPPQFDLKQQLLEAARTQFSGFYFPHLKEIVLVQYGSIEATTDVYWFSHQTGFLWQPPRA
jgi:hypothetical protein